MARFVFRLQPLLNVKKQVEESLKNELGKAIQKLENEKRRLIEIVSEKDNNIVRFNLKASQGVAVKKLKEYNAYISLLKEKIEFQKENVNFAQNIVDKYREELVKAVQEKEMLEKLKDKLVQEFIKEQLKEEQRINDEIISYKFNDRSVGDGNG